MRVAVAVGEHRMITQQQLSGYLGKSMTDICPNGHTDETASHGAHFVAHVLGYRFGLTCQMMGTAQGPAASVRIQDLFQHCPKLGVWSLRPASMTTCLVFITRASNVNLAARVIASVPRQHVGLLVDGFVWHYSNRQRTVVRQTPAQFARHYAGPDNALFYGSLP
jgi:hypothetical protein